MNEQDDQPPQSVIERLHKRTHILAERARQSDPESATTDTITVIAQPDIAETGAYAPPVRLVGRFTHYLLAKEQSQSSAGHIVRVRAWEIGSFSNGAAEHLLYLAPNADLYAVPTARTSGGAILTAQLLTPERLNNLGTAAVKHISKQVKQQLELWSSFERPGTLLHETTSQTANGAHIARAQAVIQRLQWRRKDTAPSFALQWRFIETPKGWRLTPLRPLIVEYVLVEEIWGGEREHVHTPLLLTRSGRVVRQTLRAGSAFYALIPASDLTLEEVRILERLVD